MLDGISNFELKREKNGDNTTSSCSPRNGDFQSLAAICAKPVEKNTREPL
jgi:hypothetical protein